MDGAFDFNKFSPIGPGITPAASLRPLGFAPLARAKINSKTRLADIQDDYSFYHPGLIYSKVPLEGRDPFLDFGAWLNDSGLQPVSFLVGNKFLSGMDAEWCRTLHALEKNLFVDYLPFISNAVFIDRRKKTVWRVRFQDLRIVDPSMTINDPAMRTVRVIFFGLETNKGSWYFDENKDGTVALKFDREVSAEVKQIADALLGDNIQVLED